MVALLNFLNHVLPPEGQGHRCWVSIKNKRITGQGLTPSNADLDYLLRGIDSRSGDAYLACSTFKDPSLLKPRVQENVEYVKSFWLDVDAGPHKPYPDYETAKQAVLKFCTDAGLPIPTLVCSGNGVHAWWTLENSISGEEWTGYARALKKLTKTHGLEADPSRTADRSSILRPPTTCNWKNPEQPKEVYVDGNLQAFIPNYLFMERLKEAAPKEFCVSDNGVNDSILGGLSRDTNHEPSFSDLVANRCSQLQSFKTLAGNVPEPLWYTNLGVLAHCEDGEHFAQEWSKGHPLYNPAETERKLQQARDRAGPSTCARFKDLNPKGCAGCPFNITSPIQLGKKSTQDQPIPPKIEIPADKYNALPEGFQWGNNYQILAQIPDPNAEPEEKKFILITVCDFPFQIDSVRVEETNGIAGDESVKFSKRTPHSPWTSFTVDRSSLLSAGWLAVLGAKGVTCRPGTEKHFRILIHRMITGRVEMSKEEVCYGSFGWKKDRTGFVAGRKLYTREGVLNVSGNQEFEKAADKLHPHPSGDFNMWRGLANKLFTPGCEAQAFALLCAFAAPIMDLLFSSGEGGGIVSLVSHGSGRGKSTMLAAVESVWGQITSLRITEAASLAAKFRAIGIYKNLPVVIDEWGTGDAEVTREFVTTFTGGLDKNRLTQYGFSTREQLTWKTILIGSTNRPMVEQLRGSNDHAQANRIFEVPLVVPDHILNTHSAALNRAFEKCYGFAGPVFISHLLRNFDLNDLEAKANGLLETFAAQLKLSNDYRFNLRIVAACAVVAQILTTPLQAGAEPMLNFKASGPIQWALNVVSESAKNREGRSTFEQQIAEFIRENMYDFVVVNGPYNAKVPTQLFNRPKRDPKGRYEKSSARLYVPNALMRKFALSLKIPYDEFCTALMASGVLIQRNRMTMLSAGVEEMTVYKAPCWEIDVTHEAIGDTKQILDVEPPKV